jgi:hypothetical protein
MPVRHGDHAYEKQEANSVSIESEFAWRTAKRVPPNCGTRFFIAECFWFLVCAAFVHSVNENLFLSDRIIGDRAPPLPVQAQGTTTREML